MQTQAKVLVVEGKTKLADQVVAQLKRLGYECIIVLSNGEDVINHCKVTPPDLLVMGTKLEGMMGVQATVSILRQDRDIPLVYLTEQEDQEGARIPRQGSVSDTARAIAHAYGVGSTARDFEPPQDFILHDRILLRHQEQMLSLPIQDMEFVVARRSYSGICVGGQEYLISIAVPLVEHQLARHGFLRVHARYLVNLRQIEEVGYDRLYFRTGTIPVGRRYRKSVQRQVRNLQLEQRGVE